MVRLKNRDTGVIIVVDEVTADALGPEWADPEDVPDAPAESEEGEDADESGGGRPRKKSGAHAKTDG